MKIKKQILIGFLSVFIATYLIYGIVNYFLDRTTIVNQISDRIQINTVNRYIYLQSFIKHEKILVADLAAATVFRDFLTATPNTSGYTTQLTRINGRITRTLQTDSDIAEMLILDQNGIIVANSTDAHIGLDKSRDTFFINAQKKPYLKDIHKSDLNGKIVYSVSSPIFDDNNKLLGVVVLEMNTTELDEIYLNYTGLGNTGESFLINSDRYLITPTRYLGINSILEAKVDTENSQACFSDINFSAPSTEVTPSVIIKKYIDYRGVPIIGTHLYIPETGWCMITKMDQSEYNKLLNSQVFIFIGIGGISFVVFFITGLFIASRISKPIEILQHGSELVKQGNLSIKVGFPGNNEVSKLSQAFDEMTASIVQSRRDVDRKVEEQTKEIQEKSITLENQQKALVNVLEDVNKEKNQALIQRSRYESLLSDIADGVIATDNESNIILMNKAAENLLGLDLNEVLGKKLSDVFQIVDINGTPLPLEMRPITIAAKTKKPFIASVDSNYYYVNKSGNKFPVALSAAPVIVNDDLIGVIDVFRDITHEKEVDRMKTEFITLSSHQLRTPLSAIKWFLEMLLTGDVGPLTKEQTEFIKNINQSNERMITLVNSLLNISRIELGRIAISPQPTDLRVLVEDLVREIQNKIDEKKLHLIISIDPGLGKVSLDPKLIYEVYKNFLTNSVKYTHEGGEITIFISREGDEVISKITDNGYGIPQAEQSRIFEKFYRGSNVIKHETEGTGLGLYLVKSIVESSGGKVWFESTENKGATFWFSLPVKNAVQKTGEVSINPSALA